MNQNHQAMIEESHVAFKNIVSIVEKYDEDVQFALRSFLNLAQSIWYNCTKYYSTKNIDIQTLIEYTFNV